MRTVLKSQWRTYSNNSMSILGNQYSKIHILYLIFTFKDFLNNLADLKLATKFQAKSFCGLFTFENPKSNLVCSDCCSALALLKSQENGNGGIMENSLYWHMLHCVNMTFPVCNTSNSFVWECNTSCCILAPIALTRFFSLCVSLLLIKKQHLLVAR